MLDALLSVSRAVASEVQSSLAEHNPGLARGLDLPQRQRFLELIARGFDTFLHGLARATQAEPSVGTSTAYSASGASTAVERGIVLGPAPIPDSSESSEARIADDDAFAEKFARLFLDMGGIFPKLAQILSLRPDLIKNERVLQKLRAVQEECKCRAFPDAMALVGRESQPFREGRCELRDWQQYVHAGSIAQVAPFVFVDGIPAATGSENVAASLTEPDGVVKFTWADARETMEIDFRLLRTQLSLMERAGPNFQGLGHLSPQHLRMIQEVWNVIIGLEDEILQEFNLSHEAACQDRGSVVVEGLIGSKGEECAWLEAWRDRALRTVLKPAGSDVSSQAVEAWRSGASRRQSGGFMTRLAMRLWFGRSTTESLAKGEEYVNRLRDALRRLEVRVPEIYHEMSGPHVLGMQLARGRSLKEVLDVALKDMRGTQLQSDGDDAQKAAAWFVALLLFVILPIWGKMLLVVGCCHADPHPGNFKVSGIPGLDDEPPQPTPDKKSRLFWRSSSPNQQQQTGPPELVLSILDWGSCVDLEDGTRETLCKLILGLHDLRWARRQLEEYPEDVQTRDTNDKATTSVAICMRLLGVQMEASDDNDEFLATVAMALFDPALARSHPRLHSGDIPELGKCFPVGSVTGKVLRVVAILVGICRELENRMNAEAVDRTGDVDRTFVDLFLVELWRPFAEEGLS